MPRLKVLISGGGITGNTLAFWLAELGHDVTVVEWFPSLRASGLQVDLRGHGIEVMRRMGLEAAVRSKSAPETGLQVVDKSGRRWAYFPATQPGGKGGLANPKADVGEKKAALAEIFRGAGWQTEEILKALQEDVGDFYCERLGIVKMESWPRGRLALLGDAAYCPSVKTGMGTTSGMVGAYILAGEIGRHCGRSDTEVAGGEGDITGGLANALKAYDDKFRPFMDQVQKGILEDEGGLDMMPSSAFGIALFNCIMGIASFFKVDVIAKFNMRENVKGWDLPDYEEMRRG
ncbi:Uu.00g114690.m01.CDS01 [Anthostomella pinea]|uniref:Uu.00g114690.m01.CDS01 n=1 Tax=Anthostomella pinea TaxID=933095 RepID=A0AAI8VGN1_9PEZI|nr:Uu.00g114690.m01.CDS01 [Anthostomella pinea]